jgi:hypothetical protein
MTSYKEYKLEDYVRRCKKQSLCLNVKKITLYGVCGECGKRNMKVLLGEDTQKPIVPSEFLCDCGTIA